MVVLGNLGTVGMIVNGYQRLGAPGGVTEHATLPTRIGWTIQGIGRVLKGAHMPYPPGEWYWIPSRIIPDQEGNSITEFPYFTFLYADMHPHMIAMPVALLALAWAVGIVFGRARWKGIGGFAVSFFLGGLAIGALYPINLSDTYTYLLLGIVAIGYTLWVSFDITRFKLLSGLPVFSKRLLITIGGIALLYILSKLLYQPYSAWYGQAYGSLEMWKGHRTPISSYLSHWGLFLFVIISWMAWETRDWMAHTPLSSLRKLEPYVGLIYTGLVVLLGVMAAQQLSVMNPSGSGVKWHGVSIIWLVLPLVAWAGILILRPGLLEAKRVTLFLIGTALMITLVVDIVVVKGDIGRMNTVFKFYLQAWTLFAVSGAVALGWLLLALKDWLPGWRIPWKIIFVALVVSAGLYTVIAGKDKISDRMAPDSPHTLDGMASYMPYSTYNEGGVNLDLSRDYRAIRWMQENIEGSPVMVEAYNGGSYRWFSRFVINTGLPDVVGWEWHQQQQRALLPAGWVTQRMREIGDFYQTTDPKLAEEFLRKYDVRYIIFGELEKVAYASPGLEKFASLDGVLWHRVYPPPGTPNPENETIIYEVIQP
jgi:YYY domain-containing protein